MPTALLPPAIRPSELPRPSDPTSPVGVLPCDGDYQPEEELLESFLHGLQTSLLLSILAWYLGHMRGLQRWALGGHGFLFYDPTNRRRHIGPDFWADVDVDHYPGKTWEWSQMGRPPAVILELVSPTTGVNDRTDKRDLYERLGVREYFCYDDETHVMVAYRLAGTRYQQIAPESGGGWFSQELGLKLVLWEGEFVNVRQTWLRWATQDGELIPIPEEAADAAEQRAVTAETRAVTAETRLVSAEAQVVEERARAASAEERARQDQSRAAAAEAETRRLQDLLRTLGYTTRPG